MLTADELRQLRRLRVQLDRRVDSPFAGQYRSAIRGRGMEFEDVRAYVPGDDVRHIDWNVTARTGEPHVKVFREERELTLLLVVDASGSMRVGSGGLDGRTDKRLQAARLAGALAWAALGNRDRVGLLAFTDRVEEVLPPRKAPGHAWRVVRAAYGLAPERRGTDLVGALDRAGRLLRRRSVVCVVSDFLCPAPWERALALLCRRHRVHALLVHDPLEAAAPAVGLVELVDAETGARRLVDAGALRARVPVEERLAALRRAGARAAAVGTDEDAFAALERHFRWLERLR